MTGNLALFTQPDFSPSNLSLRHVTTAAHTRQLYYTLTHYATEAGNNNEDVGDPAGDTGRAGGRGRPPGKQRLLSPGETHLVIVMEIVKFVVKV